MTTARAMSETFVIAEAGVNHNGDIALAIRLVDAAIEAGVDAVKFQAFSPEHIVTADAPKATYQDRNDPGSSSQIEMLRGLQLSADEFRALRDHCRGGGIEFLCTPFDQPSLDLLVRDLGVDRLKIGSGEMVNAPLLWNAARSGLPLIVSTGMAELDEIALALGVIAHGLGFGDQAATPNEAIFTAASRNHDAQTTLRRQVILLHAVSDYPARIEAVNLRAMDVMRERFGLEVGYSDHTQGIAVPIAAAAMGAVVIEKHFTLDRTMEGPDHKASLEPDELTAMVQGIRDADTALGRPVKTLQASEAATRLVARKSLVASAPIQAGEAFREDNLTTKRPGGGIAPIHYWRLLDRSASRTYEIDDPIDETLQ
jgi:N-acetylneuraminate synthase